MNNNTIPQKYSYPDMHQTSLRKELADPDEQVDW
jgi:hypothetical protein